MNCLKYYVSAFLITTAIAISGCSLSGGHDYNRLVKKELAKGTRSDSLFMGIYLGMPSKAFYAHCWELNKKGVFTNGSNNTSVLYKPGKDLKYQSSMNFYPDFHNDKIYKMRVTLNYDAWAPWNKSMGSDSLLVNTLNLFKTWYPGNPFLTIQDKNRGTIYVKVDGNRRIIVGKYDDIRVKVDYTDVSVEKSLVK